MRRLVYLTTARRDFVSILKFITQETANPVIGRRGVDQLRQQCQELASLPGTLGRPRPELRADIRSFLFRRYVIFFRYADDRLEIVNVIEAHRDIVAYFRDQGS